MKIWLRVLFILVLAGATAAGAQTQPQTPVLAETLSERAIDARIQQYRTAAVTLTVIGTGGKPLSGAAVTIRQTRHKFLFGANAFLIQPDNTEPWQAAYQKALADLMNYATLGFYWGMYEREEGRTDAARLRAQAEWCRTHGLRVKGHPLCWMEVPPRWLAGRPAEEVHALQIARIRRDAGEFKDIVDAWDVVNEATWLNGPPDHPIRKMFELKGTMPMIKEAFDLTRAAAPGKTLLLNDYKIKDDYKKLIADCLAAGVGIDAIGIQSHMHDRVWSAENTWATCERFKDFGKPLHFTEVTILSGPNPRGGRGFMRGAAPTPTPTPNPEGEAAQSRDVARFYRLLFSHPAVEAITWWDLSDRGAWKRAPAGLLRRDMTPKPAYLELQKLIKGAWWTKEVKLTADQNGTVNFRGFLGDYAIETPGGKGVFKLVKAGEEKVDVSVK